LGLRDIGLVKGKQKKLVEFSVLKQQVADLCNYYRSSMMPLSGEETVFVLKRKRAQTEPDHLIP
jgi:hypothetical protein